MAWPRGEEPYPTTREAIVELLERAHRRGGMVSVYEACREVSERARYVSDANTRNLVTAVLPVLEYRWRQPMAVPIEIQIKHLVDDAVHMGAGSHGWPMEQVHIEVGRRLMEGLLRYDHKDGRHVVSMHPATRTKLSHEMHDGAIDRWRQHDADERNHRRSDGRSMQPNYHGRHFGLVLQPVPKEYATPA